MRVEVVNGSHLERLPVVRVHYAPKSIDTVAIQATPETIGAMAIEFGCEINRNNGTMHLMLLLERTSNDGTKKLVDRRAVFLNEWLVELEGDVYVFPDEVMWNTFSQAQDPAHQMTLSEGVIDKEDFRTGFMSLPVELQHPEKLPDLPA